MDGASEASTPMVGGAEPLEVGDSSFRLHGIIPEAAFFGASDLLNWMRFLQKQDIRARLIR